MSELTERIFAACCPDSTIDVYAHAARICEVVTESRLAGFRSSILDDALHQQVLEVER